MIILAIDPGTRESGAVLLDTDGYKPIVGDWSGCSWREAVPMWAAIMENSEIVKLVRDKQFNPDIVICEMPQYYGKDSHVGLETFEMCVWIGRFMEASHGAGSRFERLPRPGVRAQICGTPRSDDKMIRQALIDRFGGDSVALKGKKCPSKPIERGWLPANPPHFGCKRCDGSGWLRKPGPLAGITSHMWSALAVAVTWAELHPEVSDGR